MLAAWTISNTAADTAREALAAVFRCSRQSSPAAPAILAERLGEPGGAQHLAVLEAGAVTVAFTVQGREHLVGEPTGLLQDRAEGWWVEVGVGVTDDVRQACGLECEEEVRYRRREHSGLPSGVMSARPRRATKALASMLHQL